ncbi:hypothetical protein F5Y04DRAFT_162111 [Hypomontagnella monticulosa]|nr:hypothetical protein F5Y04DRAFT_162111 [Hypomontagnella monticulosa]
MIQYQALRSGRPESLYLERGSFDLQSHESIFEAQARPPRRRLRRPTQEKKEKEIKNHKNRERHRHLQIEESIWAWVHGALACPALLEICPLAHNQRHHRHQPSNQATRAKKEASGCASCRDLACHYRRNQQILSRLVLSLLARDPPSNQRKQLGGHFSHINQLPIAYAEKGSLERRDPEIVR